MSNQCLAAPIKAHIAPCVQHDDSSCNETFLQLLPDIQRQAAYYLRHVRNDERAEAIAEVIAHAFVSFVRLVKQGKSDAVFAGPLARFGALRYLYGRKVGGHVNARDVMSSPCQRRTGVAVHRLGSFDQPPSCWRELLVENPGSGPAEVAATRIDFAAWLRSLPERNRALAEQLARGETTGRLASMYDLSPGRISQIRTELYDSWRAFQREGCWRPN